MNNRWTQQRGMIPALTLGWVVGSFVALAPSPAQVPTDRPIPLATAAARVSQREQQTQQIIGINYDLQRYPISDRTETHWRKLLWATAIVEPQDQFVTGAIASILQLAQRSDLSGSQRRILRMAMQVGTQLYLSDYLRDRPTQNPLREAFEQIIQTSPTGEWVAMAVAAIVQADRLGAQPSHSASRSTVSTKRNSATWVELVKTRFPRWQNDLNLYTTLQDLAQTETPLPPLTDLLQWSIAPNQFHLYVFCRPNRYVLCQAILKDAQGQFVRQGNRLWSVPLMARSLHHLSWNFPRGNTPQGIYRIEGTIPQPDTEFFRAYGLFPLVNLFVPFEAGVKEFVAGQRGPLGGTLTSYQNLLPPSWQNYFPIQQSYWAGKAGRGLFRIHGSGEPTTFFSNTRHHRDSSSWNPAIGCLSALELYDDSGRLQQADMPRILEALGAIAGRELTGYMVVVDIPGDDQTPVSVTMLEELIK